MSSPARIEGVVLRAHEGTLSDPLLRYGIIAGLLVAACGASVAAYVTGSLATQGFLLCASGVMGVTAIALGRARGRHETVVALELSTDALTLVADRQRTEIPWSAVTRWAVRPSPDGVRDELWLRLDDGRAWGLTLPDDDALATVRTAVGRCFSRRALTVPLRGGVDTSGLTALVVLLSVAAPMPLADTVMRACGPLAGALAWAVGFALATRLVMEVCVSRVTVGGDGVSLRRNGAERFVPWPAISDVDWDELGVVLRLVDGEEVALPVLSNSMVRDLGDGAVERAVRRRDALYDRLRVELDAWRARQTDDDGAEALLDRRGRSLEDWRAAAMALLAQVAGYRSVRLDPCVAARVIEDPAAPIERRVAAVWALREHDGRRASTRVRVALDAAASEPVREALGLAARDELDEVALDRALDAAEHGC
jgi:Bacterial PH domain